MLSDILKFISLCTTCAQVKVPRTLPARKLLPFPTPQQPWSPIAIDFVTDLLVSQGNTVIIVIIELFSKSLHLIPLPDLPFAFETANLIFSYVFRYFGIPEDIVRDRGPQFTSWLWWSIMEKLGVSVSLTSCYHSKANGQEVIANKEINQFLMTFVPIIKMTCPGSLHHAATQLSSFQRVHALLPIKMATKNSQPASQPT